MITKLIIRNIKYAFDVTFNAIPAHTKHKLGIPKEDSVLLRGKTFPLFNFGADYGDSRINLLGPYYDLVIKQKGILRLANHDTDVIRHKNGAGYSPYTSFTEDPFTVGTFVLGFGVVWAAQPKILFDTDSIDPKLNEYLDEPEKAAVGSVQYDQIMGYRYRIGIGLAGFYIGPFIHNPHFVPNNEEVEYVTAEDLHDGKYDEHMKNEENKIYSNMNKNADPMRYIISRARRTSEVLVNNTQVSNLVIKKAEEKAEVASKLVANSGIFNNTARLINTAITKIEKLNHSSNLLAENTQDTLCEVIEAFSNFY